MDFFRQKFKRGQGTVKWGTGWAFYLTIASLIVPSILISLGIGVVFQVMAMAGYQLVQFRVREPT